MIIHIGGIYTISSEWSPYNDDILNHRPIIVLRTRDDYVDGVLLGVRPKESHAYNSVFFDYTIKEEKYISRVACDIIHRVPINLIQDNLGHVTDQVLEEIFDKSIKYMTIEKQHLRREYYAKNVIKIDETNINFTLEKCENILSDIDNTTKNTNKIIVENDKAVQEAQKPINKWKERFKGMIFTIITSIIADTICNYPNSMVRFMKYMWKLIVGLF